MSGSDLYCIAGQTIFQIVGMNGAPQLQWESYLAANAVDEFGQLDRSLAIQRSKQEFELEQAELRALPAGFATVKVGGE